MICGKHSTLYAAKSDGRMFELFFISERSILVLIFNHCRLLKSLLSCNRFQINIFNKVFHETTLVNCAYPLAFNINC